MQTRHNTDLDLKCKDRLHFLNIFFGAVKNEPSLLKANLRPLVSLDRGVQLSGRAMEGRDEREGSPTKSDRSFGLTYIGWSSLDRRTTLPMLPWLVAEIRRRSEKGDCGPGVQPRDVQLLFNPPFLRCVPASCSNSSVFIFEHKAQLISRFIHNSNDLTYFAYLLRGQPDNPESEMSCHVFRAPEPKQVGPAGCY